MSKRRLLSTVLSTLMLMWFATTPAFAQAGDRMIGFGPVAGMEFDGTTPFLGAAVRIGTPLTIAENELVFDGDFEYYLDTGDATVWGIQGALLLPLIIENSQVRPYVGSGLVLRRISVDTDTPFGNFGASDTNIQLALIGGFMVRAFFADLALRVGDGDGVYGRVGFLALGNIL